MPVQIEVPPGHRLVTKTSTSFPKDFNSIERISSNRKWWQFWKPKSIYKYTVVERIPEPYWICN